MTMQATVLRVQENALLVFQHATSQRILVHTAEACRFRVGDVVCIQYSGAMTFSIPPQITAINIRVLPRFGPRRHLC